MQRLLLFFLLIVSPVSALYAQKGYEVRYHLADKDSFTTPESLGLRLVFSSKDECFLYMESLVKNRKALGYVSFSIDSLYYDSSFAEAWIYVGEKYLWDDWSMSEELQTVAESAGILRQLEKKTVYTDSLLTAFREKMLRWLENNGYPFASVGLDSIMVKDNRISGRWILHKGPLYKIDSIKTEGTAKISKHFLHQYLGIPAGSIYKKEKLDLVSSKLRELSFLEEASPWNMSMVGTGSTLNLNLNTKRSSRVNALIGFLPGNEQLKGKTLITGEVNIFLQNAVGKGETIGLNWQQLQVHSPRLNIQYQHPFLFRSGYGIDLQLDLFKKDSSFLNINFLAGVIFQIDQRSKGKFFYQRLVSNLISVNTNAIKQLKILPEQLDMRASLMGLDYQFTGTDYLFNPRKGMEFGLVLSAGIRKINKNSFIEELKKDAFGQPYSFAGLYDSLSLRTYVVRTKMNIARYIKTGKQSTIRLGLSAGLIASKGKYRNELFQIGGYKLLRGFDEESIYTDRYMVASGEYRYLIGRNAYMYAFSDLGLARVGKHSSYYWGNGFGISLETKAGLLNLSYAVGKQEKTNFSLANGKIHFGFVSIF